MNHGVFPKQNQFTKTLVHSILAKHSKIFDPEQCPFLAAGLLLSSHIESRGVNKKNTKTDHDIAMEKGCFVDRLDLSLRHVFFQKAFLFACVCLRGAVLGTQDFPCSGSQHG